MKKIEKQPVAQEQAKLAPEALKNNPRLQDIGEEISKIRKKVKSIIPHIGTLLLIGTTLGTTINRDTEFGEKIFFPENINNLGVYEALPTPAIENNKTAIYFAGYYNYTDDTPSEFLHIWKTTGDINTNTWTRPTRIEEIGTGNPDNQYSVRSNYPLIVQKENFWQLYYSQPYRKYYVDILRAISRDEGNTWGEIERLPEPINSEEHGYRPLGMRDGLLYVLERGSLYSYDENNNWRRTEVTSVNDFDTNDYIQYGGLTPTGELVISTDYGGGQERYDMYCFQSDGNGGFINPMALRQLNTREHKEYGGRVLHTDDNKRWFFYSTDERAEIPAQVPYDFDLVYVEIINPNHPPSANLYIENHQDFYEPGETIIINAENSYDEDGDYLNYIWNLDNGTTVAGRDKHKLEYSYNELGEYVITLTVDDFREEGTNSASIGIIVSNGETTEEPTGGTEKTDESENTSETSKTTDQSDETGGLTDESTGGLTDSNSEEETNQTEQSEEPTYTDETGGVTADPTSATTEENSQEDSTENSTHLELPNPEKCGECGTLKTIQISTNNKIFLLVLSALTALGLLRKKKTS